jgi:hypothetical protein
MSQRLVQKRQRDYTTTKADAASHRANSEMRGAELRPSGESVVGTPDPFCVVASAFHSQFHSTGHPFGLL